MAGFTMMSGAEFVAAMEAEGIEGSDDVVGCQDCGASYVAGIDEHEPNNCVPVLRTTLARLTAGLAAVTAERDEAHKRLDDWGDEVPRDAEGENGATVPLTLSERIGCLMSLAELCDSAAAEMAQERDALQRHFDAAAPEHNLPALLDLYFERQQRAEKERDEARGLLGECLDGEWIECVNEPECDDENEPLDERHWCQRCQMRQRVAAHLGRAAMHPSGCRWFGGTLALAHSLLRTRLTTAERELAEARALLREAREVLALCTTRTLSAPEDAEVRALGMRIGFGALMSAVSKGWADFLSERYPEAVGAHHTTGPCEATVQCMLAKLDEHLEESK